MRLVHSFGCLALVTLAAAAACSDTMSAPTTPLASPTFAKGAAGGGGAVGGGGAAAPLLDVSGVWTGSWVPATAAGTPQPGAAPRPFTLHVTEDASGNLGGFECVLTASDCVLAVGGKVDKNGTVNLLFNFAFKGVPATIVCPDGSPGLEIVSPGPVFSDTSISIYEAKRCS